MWMTRLAGLALGTGLLVAPAAAEDLSSQTGIRSKEMLTRAQTEANRRSAEGLLDQIEAQRRRIDPADAAKLDPPPDSMPRPPQDLPLPQTQPDPAR